MSGIPQLDILENSEFREALSNLISKLLNAKLKEFIIQREKEVREISMVEKLLRVEEELEAMRELHQKQFEALLREVVARHQTLQVDMDRRFEAS